MVVIKINNKSSNSINIHNIYNSFFVSYSFKNNSFTMLITKQQLQNKNKHILFGNFNLHHSYWNEFFKLTQHAATNALLNAIQNANINLILSRNIVMWKTKNPCNIIDLMFITNNLSKKVKRCKIKSKMNQSFDHILVFIKLRFAIEPMPVKKIIQKIRCGKN